MDGLGNMIGTGVGTGIGIGIGTGIDLGFGTAPPRTLFIAAASLPYKPLLRSHTNDCYAPIQITQSPATIQMTVIKLIRSNEEKAGVHDNAEMAQ